MLKKIIWILLSIGLMGMVFISCSEESSIEPYTDTEKPTVSLLAPANNTVITQGTVLTCIGDASDNESIVKVDFYIDGVIVSSDSTSPYEYEWDTSGLEQSHTLKLKAYDPSDNMGESNIVVVTIGNSLNNLSPLFDIPSNSIEINGLDSIPFYYEIIAHDTENDSLNFSCEIPSNEQDWLSANFTDSSIVLSGFPTKHNTVFNQPFTVTAGVNDSYHQNGDILLTYLTIRDSNYVSIFTSNPILTSSEDNEYSYTVTAYDYDDDNIYISIVEAPSWLWLYQGKKTPIKIGKEIKSNTTAYLRGTPLQEHIGENLVKLKVFDGLNEAFQEFIITVESSNDAPIFTSTPDSTNIPKYINYTYTITATDEDGDNLIYNAELLPDWMEFDISTKTLSGVPENSEVGVDNKVKFSVSDNDTTVYQTFNIEVINNLPTFTSTPRSSITENCAYTYTVMATDVDVSDVLTYSATQLPDWLTFNSATQELSGTPTFDDYGNNNISLKVEDGVDFVTQNFSIYVSHTISMISVDGGTFEMGGGYGATPIHTVTLSSFSIGKYEITQREYEDIIGFNPSEFIDEINPVESVNWYETLVFCNIASINENLEPCYRINGSTDPEEWGTPPSYFDPNPDWDAVICDWTANGYRLPTEAEWEFACRGGNNSDNYTYSGSNTIDEVAWYEDNSDNTTHPVGLKLPNELGIFDMSGNVVERCWDWEGDYSSNSQTNPTGPDTGEERILRGGGYSEPELFSRSTMRSSYLNVYGFDYHGFRVVRNLYK